LEKKHQDRQEREDHEGSDGAMRRSAAWDAKIDPFGVLESFEVFVSKISTVSPDALSLGVGGIHVKSIEAAGAGP
jgi:hypothetical protein